MSSPTSRGFRDARRAPAGQEGRPPPGQHLTEDFPVLALGSIEDGLAGSDPRLASMLTIFSRLAADEEMPTLEKIRVRRGWPAARHPRRIRRRPRRGIVRRLYARLGWQQAMLLLWVVISAGLLAVALVLNASGHKICIQSMRTACSPPSHSMPVRLTR